MKKTYKTPSIVSYSSLTGIIPFAAAATVGGALISAAAEAAAAGASLGLAHSLMKRDDMRIKSVALKKVTVS